MADTDRRKIQGEVSLDASGVREGAQEATSAVRQMAGDMQAAGKQAATGFKPVETGAAGAGAAVSRAEKSMVASIERATVAMRSGGKAGADYYEMLAKQRGISGDVLAPYIKQLREAEAAQAALSRTAGMSDKATAAALRGVPAQFTDILVSLQGGQNPLTVFLQQGGQLKDMFGGAGMAAKALGGYILGLVNPLTVTAAAVGVLGLAYYQGSQEADAYAKSIIMTGNAAGTTVGQLAAMAQELDGKGFTESAAASALAQVAASGNVARDSISKVAEVAMRLERDAGIPIADTVKAFDELGKSPVEASLKLTEQHRYLTTEIYEQIKALKDQGRQLEAATLAQETYATTMIGRTDQMVERLGIFEGMWKAAGSAAAKAWDNFRGIGRGETPETRLAAMQAELEKGADGRLDFFWNPRKRELEKQIADLQSQVWASDLNSWGEAEHNRVQLAGTKAAAAIEKANTSALTKQEQLNKALKEYRDNLEDVRKANPNSALLNPEQIAKAEEGIRERFKEKGGASTNAASRRLDLSGIQSAMREEVAMLDQQQRAMDLQRQAGLMSEQDYYTQKRALIEQAGKVEKKGLQEQITRLEAEKSKGADAINAKRQLGETRAKLALKEIELQNKLTQADTEAAVAKERHEKAMAAQLATHQRYVAQMQLQAERSVGTAWMGDKDRQRLEQQWAVQDKYLVERRRLEDQRDFTPNLSDSQRKLIDQRLKDIEVEQREELKWNAWKYDQLDQMQTKWQLGASQAMQNYADQASNVAGQVGNVFTKAFQGMEDALVSFAMTGKADFASMANSIIADIIRIQIRASMVGSDGKSGWLSTLVNAGMSWLTGGSAGASSNPSQYSLTTASNYNGGGMGLSFGGYRANGGPVDAGKVYEVNERGDPELLTVGNKQMLLMAKQPGYVTALRGGSASGAASGAAGAGVVVNIHNNAGAQVEQQQRTGADGHQIIDVFIKQAVSAVAGQLASDSGQVGQAMRARKSMGMG